MDGKLIFYCRTDKVYYTQVRQVLEAAEKCDDSKIKELVAFLLHAHIKAITPLREKIGEEKTKSALRLLPGKICMMRVLLVRGQE